MLGRASSPRLKAKAIARTREELLTRTVRKADTGWRGQAGRHALSVDREIRQPSPGPGNSGARRVLACMERAQCEGRARLPRCGCLLAPQPWHELCGTNEGGAQGRRQKSGQSVLRGLTARSEEAEADTGCAQQCEGGRLRRWCKRPGVRHRGGKCISTKGERIIVLDHIQRSFRG